MIMYGLFRSATTNLEVAGQVSGFFAGSKDVERTSVTTFDLGFALLSTLTVTGQVSGRFTISIVIEANRGKLVLDKFFFK